MTTPDDPQRGRDNDDAEDRAAILRRRAVFIASAIAGLGLGAGCSDPRPCLNIAVVETDAGAPDAAPAATQDAGSSDAGSGDAGSTTGPNDAGSGDAGSGDAGSSDAGDDAGDAGKRDAGRTTPPRPPPRPCLKPHPCLKVADPDGDL